MAEVVKRFFSQVLQQEGSYIYGAEVLVTVTNVQISPDLSVAKVYVSVYNTENKQAVILEMEQNYYRLKQIFAAKIKKHIRRIPNLSFFLDDTLDEMYRLNSLFNNLDG